MRINFATIATNNKAKRPQGRRKVSALPDEPKGKRTKVNDDTQKRELELNVQAWQEIEDAGHDTDAVEAYRAYVGADVYAPLWGAGEDGEAVMQWENWIDDFEESYQGESSTRDFAEQLADTLYLDDSNLPQWVSSYFDYEKFERDLFMGDYWESNGYIFRSI